MERKDVKSSNIKSVGWEKKIGDTGPTLEVEFINGGVYSYSPVSEDLYNELMAAESIGRLFSTKIKKDKNIHWHKVVKTTEVPFIKEWPFRLFFMKPPISKLRKAEIHEFNAADFESAYTYSKKYVSELAENTQILMLAQIDR